MKRTGRSRRKTRHKLAKHYRNRGKISLTEFFKELNIGDKVCLKAEPSYQKGMYHPRYHGKVATVIGKRGECYEVILKDGSKEKIFIVHPIHLKRLS